MSLVPFYQKAMREASKVLVKDGRMAILDIQPFRRLLRIFNPILSSQIKPYAPDPAKYQFPDAKKCIQVMKELLHNVELEEHYFGMIYIISGVKASSASEK
jgi:ubiquinone/menaquinone biosynthesis C-methylase UbiE